MQDNEAAATASDAEDSTSNNDSEPKDAEVKRLRVALQKAEDTIKAMEESRRTIARRLQALGETVIVEPRTVQWLREEIDRSEGDFFAMDTEVGCDEDATEEERRITLYTQNLRDALDGNFAFDKDGYIDEDGRYIEFEPTDEQMDNFHWSDVGYSNGH